MGFAKPIEQYLFSNLLIRIHVFMYLKDIIREEDNTWKCVESGDIQYYQSIPYEFLTYKNRKKQEDF